MARDSDAFVMQHDDGHDRTYRINRSQIEERDSSGQWIVVTPREMTKRYPHDSKVWGWLRDNGFRRESSGPSTSNKRRTRKVSSFTLSEEVKEKIRRVARRDGISRSDAVEEMVRSFPDRKTGKREG